ncbi:MAG: TlpA disulfide reductase family protein [Thiobacillus sp.]|nr:TlpA disulfide reductase family protein [Thiobacillus sp.]MDP2979543.1 TlpA disulfide reductase family protein [Thiobacillus sp.]
MDKQTLKKWTPSPLTLILLGLIVWLWFRPPADVSEENRPASAWAVTLPDGRALSSDSLRGKVVLVNFWATWCPYCRKEKPAIDAFWQDYRDRGFEVISISIDDPAEKIAAWMQDKNYAFMAAPTNASVTAAFGNVASVPTSFIVDTEGRIRHKIAGQVHYPRLEKLVTPLLGVTKHTENP